MKKLFFASYVLALILIPIYGYLHAQTVEVTWDFPVKPGMPEWKKFNSNNEMVQACQVPTELLGTITTSQLLDISLDYPLRFDILAFNNILNGFSKFENDFNGVRELINRNDASQVIIEKYKQLNPILLNQYSPDVEKLRYAYCFSMLELFMSHKKILAQLNTDGKKELMQIILDQKDLKGQNLVWYGSFGIQTSYLAVVRILEFDNNTESLNKELIYPYVLNGISSSEEAINKINYYASSYLNK